MHTLRVVYIWITPFKGLIIVALAALALFQTSQLWIVNITNRSFFLYSNRSGMASGVSGIVRPFRLVSGLGDGLFTMRHSELGGSDTVLYGDAVFTELLANGYFLGESPLSYDFLTDSPVYLFEYAFTMPADIFARAYGMRPAVLTSRGVYAFNAAVILPPASENGYTHIIFTGEDTMWEYRVNVTGGYEAEPRNDDAGLYTWNDGFSILRPNIVPPFVKRNPYENDFGEKLLDPIKSRVSHFFDNPATIKDVIGADGVYTFRNINTVVRYYDWDVLTYASYRPVLGEPNYDLLANYAAAVAFIKSDTLVINEVYLAGYTMDGDRCTFWFNYIAGGLPLVLSDWDEPHIEVVTERGTVIKYKKLVYQYRVEG
jgi:hypothetical protein